MQPAKLIEPHAARQERLQQPLPTACTDAYTQNQPPLAGTGLPNSVRALPQAALAPLPGIPSSQGPFLLWELSEGSLPAMRSQLTGSCHPRDLPLPGSHRSCCPSFSPQDPALPAVTPFSHSLPKTQLSTSPSQASLSGQCSRLCLLPQHRP